MTKERLKQLKHLKKEIIETKEKINNLHNTLKSPNFSGLPKSNGFSDEVQKTLELIIRQEEILQQKLQRCIQEENSILEFILNVQDSKIRRILHYRFIDGLSWVQISFKLESSVDAVKMAYNRFLNKK